MPVLSSVIAALLVLFAMLPGAAEPDSSLAIINGGVAQSEDAPFVPPDYQFLPGDSVYFTFQIAGFSVATNETENVRRISLSYEITPQDANGVALAPSNSGVVKVELNPEDKNWMPRRRASFLLPASVAKGEFRMHVAVRDLLGKDETSKDFPFRIGGVTVQPSGALGVQNFRFLRQQNDREPLAVPAFSPGDTIYTNFEIVGFKIGPQNHYRVVYDLSVLRPNGTPFLQQPQAAEYDKSTFYPAQFLPVNFSITTSRDAARGDYVIVLTVRDLVGNQTCQTREAFSIE